MSIFLGANAKSQAARKNTVSASKMGWFATLRGAFVKIVRITEINGCI